MPKMIPIAILYCPVCGVRLDEMIHYPGIVYINEDSGQHFVSRRGEKPPAGYWKMDGYAPYADETYARPCDHELTKEQAMTLMEERQRQLER